MVDEDQFVELGVNSAPVVKRRTAEIFELIPSVGSHDQRMNLTIQPGGKMRGKSTELFRPTAQSGVRARFIDLHIRGRAQVPQPVGAVAEPVGLGSSSGVVVSVLLMSDQLRQQVSIAGFRPRQAKALDVDPAVPMILKMEIAKVDENLILIREGFSHASTIEAAESVDPAAPSTPSRTTSLTSPGLW